MSVSVYIKNSAFQEIRQAKRIESDRSLDGIGRMCISIVDELYQGIGNHPRDVPVFFGSAYSSTYSLHQFNVVCEREGALKVNPSIFPNTVLNAPFCRASIYHNIQSPIFNICQGRVSAMTALMLAYDHMIFSGIHQAIVCAAEESCDFVNKVEGKNLISSCGALYLSDTEGDYQIIGFTHTQDNDNDINEPYGCTNLIYKVYNELKKGTKFEEQDDKDDIVSITSGNRKLMLCRCRHILESNNG